MAMDKIIRVGERKWRGLTYLPNGQRCETWLPKGLWHAHGECEVVGDFGARSAAVMVRRPLVMPQDGIWYVCPASVAAV
jgi:hypothetical protein